MNVKNPTNSSEYNDSIYIETLEDIKEYFNDTKENKDNISKKGHLIYPTLNEYENFDSKLI